MTENRLIIIGLLVIDAILWIGYFASSRADKNVADAVVLAAAGIPTGLIGYLSKGHEPKPAPDPNPEPAPPPKESSSNPT